MTELIDVVTWSATSQDNVTSSYNVTNTREYDSNSEIIVWMDRLLPPILFTVGLISNILVVLVMKSKCFRSSSSSFYMIINAITDSLCILLALPSHYIYANFPSRFKSLQNKHWMCSLFNFIGYGTSDLGIYFTVAMTIERAIGVWKPFRINKYCTKKRARYIVVALTVFEVIKLSPMVIKSRVVDSNKNTLLCGIDRSDEKFVHFYDTFWSWFHVATLGVSYILATGGNCAIVFHVRKSTKVKHLHSGVRTIEKRMESRKAAQSKQISIMLVIDSVSLICCTLPFAIVNVLSTGWSIFVNSDGGKSLVFAFSFYLLYINRCLNLFLYCVSGERFRKEMKRVVCPSTAKRPQRRRRVHGSFNHPLHSTYLSKQDCSIESGESQSNRIERRSSIKFSTTVNSRDALPSSMARGQQETSFQETVEHRVSMKDSGIFTMGSSVLSHAGSQVSRKPGLKELGNDKDHKVLQRVCQNNDSTTLSASDLGDHSNIPRHKQDSDDTNVKHSGLRLDSYQDSKNEPLKLYYCDLFYV